METVLIIGAGGMLGHKLSQLFPQAGYTTSATIRGQTRDYARFGVFSGVSLIPNVDVNQFDSVVSAVALAKPSVIINCVGIIKQLPTAKDPIPSLTINALLPHRLAALARAAGARFIHISTDCVFNGRKGMYTENDPSDAEDLYGRSKFLGEVGGEGVLTLRTSIIGRELNTRSGLVEWFLSNRGGTVRGFRSAIYSGFTTEALARVLMMVIDQHPALSGVLQVSSEPINKYDLLCLVRAAYQADIQIEPDTSVVIDRSLDSTLFRSQTGFQPPDWQTMIDAMAADPTPYEQWKADAA